MKKYIALLIFLLIFNFKNSFSAVSTPFAHNWDASSSTTHGWTFSSSNGGAGIIPITRSGRSGNNGMNFTNDDKNGTDKFILNGVQNPGVLKVWVKCNSEEDETGSLSVKWNNTTYGTTQSVNANLPYTEFTFNINQSGEGNLELIFSFLSGSTIYDVTVDDLSLTSNGPTAPTVSSVSVPSNGTKKIGDNLDFTVNWSAAVTVTNTPRIALTVGSTTKYATYQSGSGTTATVFRYTVGSGDLDVDGIAVGSLDLNTNGTIKNASSTDATLTLNSVGSTASVNVDGVAPAVTSVTVPSNGSYKANTNLDFTVNFSENVTVTNGGCNPSKWVLNLTIGSTSKTATYLSGSGTSAIVFRYTVVTGDTDNDGISIGAITQNQTTIVDVAGNNAVLTLNSVGSTTNVLVDTQAPTVTSVTVPNSGNYITGNNLEFTVNWSENVTIHEVDGRTSVLSVTIGSTSKNFAYVSGSGTNAILYRYTVTSGDVDIDGITVGSLNLNSAAITDLSSNDAVLTLNSVGSTSSVIVNLPSPAVTSVSVPNNKTYKIGENLDFTVNWSKEVTVIGTPRIALTVGSTTKYATYLSSGSTSTASLFRYTVESGDLDTDGIVVGALELNSGTIKDGSDNDATLTLNSVGSSSSVNVDGVVPTVEITLSDNALKIGETATVTFTFTEAVTGFTAADITVANGALSNLTSSNGGITWTATLTPSSSTTDASNILTLDYTGMQDVAGNIGTGTANSPNYAIDTQRPTLASAITIDDTALKIGETATVTFNFTEAVSGFTTADLTVPNGVVSNLTTSDGGTTWTATLTPSANITDASNILTLDYTGILDLAGNAGSGSEVSGNYAIDTQRPTLASNITISDNSLKIGDVSTVTFTFTEAVSGFTTADITVENGVLSNLSSADGGITWTATLTPSASTTDASNILTLDYTGILDLAGNAGSGSEDSGNYAIDTQRPTLASGITISDTQLKIGETATVTLTFTEAVSGFTAADITVPNGKLSNLSSVDGGITWTATLTPSANTEDNTNVLTLDYTGLVDLKGNAGNSSADSPNYAIDTKNPIVTSVSVPNNGRYLVDDNLDFIINWSEEVTITGSPRIALTIGSTTKYATYNSGSTTNATIFRYTVADGDLDIDGISVGVLEINDGTIQDGLTNDATLTLNSIGSTSEVFVGGTAPEVETDNATNLGVNSATLNGEVTSDGYLELSARGFVISSTESMPDLNNATVYNDNANTEGVLFNDLSGLNSSTMYYYRAFATNNIGTSYGEVKTFSTLASEPGTQSKSITYHSITKNRIGLKWTKGDGSNRVVLASLSSLSGSDYLVDGTSYTAGDFGVNELSGFSGVYVVFNGSNTTCLVEGLTRNTTYYFRIFEYNGIGNTCNYNLNTASGNPSSKATSKKESEEIEGTNVVSIYPNPVKDMLNIDLNLPFANTTISIINEVGQEVYSTTSTNNLLSINTLNFANGVYHIIITNDDESIYHSFVIER